ncbi:universal stress protein [Pseudarthrobacter sp. AB1]|uniref:universal stress protein n=1 Tax=Pseudarthrobacter sp. AB1 TaxID=2138309 RepID=UPI00186B6D1B|nr:universal stress protein [Pseudarthrobacter sp. AB1]MBE4720032.1 universal stress protein [Pseudarthrobacter sp. AB1]
MKAHEVLAGADRSVTGQGAADWAAQRAIGRGLRLHLVRVVPEPSYYVLPAQYGEAVAAAEALLGLERDRVAARHPTLQIVTSWQAGEPAPVLSLLSVRAEIVVLGSDRSADRRGEGFGSVSFQAAVLCRSPVAVIPAPRVASRTGVVVGIDGSVDAVLALKMAAEEADRMGEALTVLHAVSKVLPPADAGGWTEPGFSRKPDHLTLISEAAGSVREKFPALTVYEALELDDSPADVLIRAAEQASLLVIGCRGRGGLRKPIGSIAEKVLMGLPCPTIITRPASGHAS